MGKKVFNVLLVAAVLLGLNSNAFGYMYGDGYGIGSRAMALGGAMTGLADDYSAAFYNPAGLAQYTGNQMVIDVIAVEHNFEVKTLSGVPLQFIDTTKKTVRLEPGTNWNGDDNDLGLPFIGMALDVNQIASKIIKIPVNIQAGVVICLPDWFNSLWSLEGLGAEYPEFFRYGDVQEHPAVTISLGIEVLKDLLYIGAGGQLNVKVEGDGHVDGVDPISAGVSGISGKTAGLDLSVNAKTELGGIVGVMVTPFMNDGVKIGATYRQGMQTTIGGLPVEANALLPLPLIGNFSLAAPIVVEVRTNYMPDEYAMGVALNLERFVEKLPVTLSLDATLSKWGDMEYTDQQYIHYVAYRTSPHVLADAPIVAVTPDFDDVINYAVGIEYRPTKALKVLLGYANKPTPAPDQSFRFTNYLDFDRSIYSLGLQYDLSGWYERIALLQKVVKRLPIELGCTFQYHDCKDYTVLKDASCDGMYWKDQESYKVEGDMWAAAVSIKIGL